MTECIRADCLCIWNTIECILVWKFSNRVKWSKKTALLCTVSWVSTRWKWLACFSAVRKWTCSLTVYNIWCNCKDRCCRLWISVCVAVSDLAHKLTEKVYSDFVCSIIVVAVSWELTVDLEVSSNTVFITDNLNLSILNSAKWVNYMWEACDTCSKCTTAVSINKSHLGSFIVILVVHIVNHIKCTYIEVSKPIHHSVILLDNLSIVKVFRSNRSVFRTYLYLCLLINTAVDSVKKTLSKVSTSAEELDFLTGFCCRYAAADWVIIAPYRTHNIIVLILNWACLNRDLRSVLLKALRKSWRIKNCEVWLRWRAHILKCVEETEVVLCNLWTAVDTDTCNFKSSPYRVTWEELVVAFDSCELNHTALHNKVVNKLLCLCLCKCTVLKVTLNINVEECRNSAYAHCSAVLSLDSCEVTKVEPLNSFFSVLSRLWNIKAVDCSHFFHAVKSLDLICDFLSELEVASSHTLTVCFGEVFLLALDKVINTVKSDSSVVAYDSASAVCIRKTCKNLVVTSYLHFRCVDIEYTLVMCLVIFCKDFVKLRAWLITVHLAWLFSHLNAAVRHKCTL